MSKLRFTFGTAAAIALLVVGALPAAAANGPVMTRDSVVFGDSTYRQCDGFTVIGGPIQLDRIFLRWYDDSGAMTLERRRVHFSGTLRNSLTGAAIPYAGMFMRTLDVTERELTLTGIFRLSVDGGRVAPIAAGREVVDLTDGEIVFRAGPSSFDAAICDLLD